MKRSDLTPITFGKFCDVLMLRCLTENIDPDTVILGCVFEDTVDDTDIYCLSSESGGVSFVKAESIDHPTEEGYNSGINIAVIYIEEYGDAQCCSADIENEPISEYTS